MARRVLVANRGEIACRVMRTCKRLGYETVAVYSEADADALHVRMADQAVLLGPAPARDSYLLAEKVIAAVRETRADAVHPGYGFLSENAEFAAHMQAEGVKWVGPPPEVIEAMGDKQLARRLAAKAGLAVLSGGQLFLLGEKNGLREEAEGIGFPLLVKAAYGGGGIGMIRVDKADDLAAAVERAQTLAQRAFGDGAVYLEKYLARARHVEVQVFGRGEGDVLVLGQRECSVQRRHQKIIEEAPIAVLSDTQRAALSEAARALAAQERYENAGTLEFLLGEDGKFFFLEMNTRLQVEHPVTEMTTGLDIVELQLKLAFDGPSAITLRQSDIQVRGHSIECRLYAEDPARNFLPAPGLLAELNFPVETAALRIETGVRQGDRVTPYYDPMIAKVVTHGSSRANAIEAMRAALSATTVQGIKCNRDFLLKLLDHPEYRENRMHTGFVETL